MLEVRWQGAAAAWVARSWPQRVRVLMALTLLIDCTNRGPKRLWGWQQAAPALPAAAISLQVPRDLRCRSSSAGGAGVPEECWGRSQRCPEMVPTGAALRFGPQTLKPPCSSKQPWGNKTS